MHICELMNPYAHMSVSVCLHSKKLGKKREQFSPNGPRNCSLRARAVVGAVTEVLDYKKITHADTTQTSSRHNRERKTPERGRIT